MTTNNELRELAEKAGSGHWYETGELRYHDDRSGEAHGIHHDEDGFIAAVGPATVLALLDEVESLQAECEKLRKLVSECADYLSHNEHTCISHGSALHSKLIDAAMQETNP